MQTSWKPVRGFAFAITLAFVSILPLTHPGGAKAAGAPVDLLPDIIAVQWALYENEFTTSIIPGRTHIRLSQITANIGAGKLHFFGGPDNGDGTQDVLQRIFRDDASYWDRTAGIFIYHSGHGHIHFEGWAIYRLREILPGDGVGTIIASGGKTSFCVFDNTLHDPSLPNHNPNQEFSTCGVSVQGLGVGWGDTYDLYTQGQNIDITGVADGEYWLEAEVDPDSTILEEDETNNIARIKVTIGTPSPIVGDVYEPNQTTADLVGRPIGSFNSPQLGPCGPQATLSSLTVHNVNSRDDWYRFYIPATGTASDYIRIDFSHVTGDLRLRLYNDAENQIESTNTSNYERNFETVSLDGHAAGWYYIRVNGNTGETSPDYQMTIDPPANSTPAVTVINPPSGDVQVLQAVETYQVTWNATDPESNETWVSVYLNSSPVLDGNEVLAFTSQNTPGSQGFYVLTTVARPLGTYYVYCSVTDGGTVSGDWADGTITIVDQVTGIGNTPNKTTALLPNVPNPFNPTTLLRAYMPRAMLVNWRIYTVRGELVRTIESGLLAEGPQQRTWDGRNDAGEFVASGVYIGVLDTPEFIDQQKLVLLK